MISYAKRWKGTVYGSFILRTMGWIYLFSSDSLNCAASIERARYSTNSYLNQGITKRPYILIFAKFSNRQRIPQRKNFKTKRNSFIISVTLTLPPSLPRPPPTPALSRAQSQILFALLFSVVGVVVSHFSPFLCLSWFLSVWKYPNVRSILL